MDGPPQISLNVVCHNASPADTLALLPIYPPNTFSHPPPTHKCIITPTPPTQMHFHTHPPAHKCTLTLTPPPHTMHPSLPKQAPMPWGTLSSTPHTPPDKLQLLPCEWNFRKNHCARSGACKSAEVTGVKVLHGSGGSFFHGMQLEFQAIYGAFNRHTLRDVMENRDFIKQHVVAELSQDPRISSGPSQCYGDAIRKTVLSLTSSF